MVREMDNGIVVQPIQPTSGGLILKADNPTVFVGSATALMGVAHTAGLPGAQPDYPHDQQMIGVPPIPELTIAHYKTPHANPLAFEVVLVPLAATTAIGVTRERRRWRKIFRAAGPEGRRPWLVARAAAVVAGLRSRLARRPRD